MLSPRVASSAPEPNPEADWEDLSELQRQLADASFVSGEPLGDRLRVRYYRRRSDGAVVGRAWFGRGALGPPDHAHGGAMASVLDEAMGIAAWLSGHRCVAARLTVDFRNLLPLGTDATFSAWIDSVDGKKIHLRGRLHGPDEVDYATSEGLFVALADEKAQEFRAKWQEQLEQRQAR